MKKHRFLLWLLSAAMLLPCLAACGGEDTASTGGASSAVVSQGESSDTEPPATEKAETVKIGKGETMEIAGENVNPAGFGIYVYTDETYALPAEGEYTDLAVVNNTIVMMGKVPYVPADGYVVRYYGIALPQDATMGATVRYSGYNPAFKGDKYVTFGEDIVIKVGYTNTTRTEEQIGFLFDGLWYAATTCSNIWGTEVAVQDGVVVEIRPSGTENSGNTPIPEGGFVLAVGAGSTYESMLKKVKVGDKAEYTRRTLSYSADRIIADTVDGIYEYGKLNICTSGATPEGSAMTEVVVNSDGAVTEILTNSPGGTAVPDGGVVLTANGTPGQTLANYAKRHKICIVDRKTVTLIENPHTLYARLESELAQAKTAYDRQAEILGHIDFEAARRELSHAEKSLEIALLSHDHMMGACMDVERAARESMPSFTLQNREAWVTVGELNYDGSPLLHYTNETEVFHAVEYAWSLGLNTLIVDNAMYGYAAYPSGVEGMVMHPALNGFDVLDAFDRACEQYGIKFVIMVNGFSSTLASVTYPENHFAHLYKDSVLISKTGKRVDAGGVTTLDPSRREVQEFNLAIAKELVERYTPDGMQVDYIRYPLPIYYQLHNYDDFGYQSPASEAFKEQYGKDPKFMAINDGNWVDWCRLRRDVVSQYAKTFYNTVKGLDSSIEVSFTCFADYNDRQLYVYQDVEMWAADGYADIIYPMIYGDNTEYQLGYAQEIHPVTEHAQVVLGVGYYVRASHQSILEQNLMPFEVDAIGVSGFTLRYISTCGYNSAVMESFRQPATPSGMEKTQKAAWLYLVDRVQKISVLFVGTADFDEIVELYDALAVAEQTIEGVSAPFAEFDPENTLLKETLQKDLEYALRFMK